MVGDFFKRLIGIIPKGVAVAKGAPVGAARRKEKALAADLENEVNTAIEKERTTVKDFGKLWAVTVAKRQDLMKQVRELNIEERMFKDLWEKVQAMERDVAILQAHDKKFDEQEEIRDRWDRKIVGGSIQVRRELKEKDRILNVLGEMIERDIEQLTKDLAKAEPELLQLANLVAKLAEQGISGEKLYVAMREIIVDINNKMNVVRKACRIGTKDIKKIYRVAKAA